MERVAAWFAFPKPLEYGMTFSGTAIIGMTLIMFVVGLETIGNISAITTTGAGRPAQDRELSGGVMADGPGRVRHLPHTQWTVACQDARRQGRCLCVTCL